MLELGSMGPKRGRLQSLEIGIEIYREIVTKLKESVEHEEETKSREKNGEKNTVISEPPADLKGISKVCRTTQWHQPSDWESRLISVCGFYTAPRRFKMQHLG